MNTRSLNDFCSSEISVPYQFSPSVFLQYSYPVMETQDLNLILGTALYSGYKIHHQWPHQYIRPSHQQILKYIVKNKYVNEVVIKISLLAFLPFLDKKYLIWRKAKICHI